MQLYIIMEHENISIFQTFIQVLRLVLSLHVLDMNEVLVARGKKYKGKQITYANRIKKNVCLNKTY